MWPQVLSIWRRSTGKLAGTRKRRQSRNESQPSMQSSDDEKWLTRRCAGLGDLCRPLEPQLGLSNREYREQQGRLSCTPQRSKGATSTSRYLLQRPVELWEGNFHEVSGLHHPTSRFTFGPCVTG